MESECKLKESLIRCDREKEELEIKCAAFEKEKLEQNQTIRFALVFSYDC